uniref:MKS transition zone complex subunit 1 n=1 Tax=Gouania willdenowi TaxID=441366 RepID=A0A8C5ENN6_GOUWI
MYQKYLIYIIFIYFPSLIETRASASLNVDGGCLDMVVYFFSGDNEEELVVGWQEKFFSQYEMELYQNEAACQTPLDRQYHTEVKAIKRGKGRRNRRIFTFTDHDRYTNCLPLAQLVGPTFLAERMASVRHRRQERRTIVPKTKIINWEPTEEFVKNSRMVNNAMQTMHVMADLGPSGRLGQKENECLLLTIKTDANGTVIVKPDFNKNKEPYRILTEGEKKDVWRLWVENVSAPMKSEEKEREQNMYKDLYVRHKEYFNSLVGQDFEMPPLGVLRYIMNGEIVSAKGFEYDNLYIHFLMELPNNWSSLPNQPLSGVTQTCQTKTLGKECVAYFSFPFSFEAFYVSDKESEELVPQWPVIYFKVLSLDSWQRYRTEGYGYVLFPALPGKHTITCHTWRPLQTGTVSALRRFFIGGSPELEDQSYVRIPGTFKVGLELSRNTGREKLNYHSFRFRIHYSSRRGNLVSVTSFNHLYLKYPFFKFIFPLTEAFQRARKRMQDARESLPKDLINATSQLHIESSA